MLALDGNSVVIMIDMSVLALRAALEPVSSIDLDARLGGYNLEAAAALGRDKACGSLQLARLCTVYDIAVVIALSEFQGIEFSIDVLADRLRAYKVHRCSRYRHGFSQRDEGVVGWKELGGVEVKDMVEDRAGTFAVKIEIDMVRKVDHGLLVCLCGESKLELVLFAPLVVRYDLEIARIAGLAVLREIHELYGIAFLAAFPDFVLESVRSAMEVVRTIVDRKLIFYSVKGEPAFRDSVGETSRAFPAAWAISEIVLRLSIADDDIVDLAVLVRHVHGYYSCTDFAEHNAGAL